MRITVIEKVPKDKIGRVNKNGVKLEPCEEATFDYLTLFGFDIEIIKPTRMKKVKNPDILICGTIWEVKTPTSCNKKTIKNRFRKAVKQAGRIVFDIRGVKRNADKVEKQIIDMFNGDGDVRHIMIARKDGKILDITK